MADSSAHAIGNQVPIGAARRSPGRAIGLGDRSVERFSGSTFFGKRWPHNGGIPINPLSSVVMSPLTAFAAGSADIRTLERSRNLMERAMTQTRALSLRANFCWTFAGNAVNAVCQWGLLLVLVHLGSPTVVGKFVLGLAIAAPIMAITMLQLRNLLVTDARGEYAFADYFGTRVTWTFLGLGAICACAWLSEFDATTTLVVMLIGAAKCADSVSDIVRGLFQRVERMDYSGMSLMIRGPAALISVGFTMWWTGSLVWAVAVLAGTWVATFILYDLVVAAKLLRANVRSEVGTRLRPRFDRATLLRLSWIALPLGVVMGVISLQTNIPRYFVQGYAGEEALGYFGALAYPMIAATMVANAMGQSASPRLAVHFVKDPTAYRRLLIRLGSIAAVVGLAFIGGTLVFGRAILTLLYDAGYAEHQRSFVILAAATAIQLVASCAGYGLTAARHIRIQVLLVSVSCLVTLAAALVFVPRSGVRGGAIAVLVTSSVMLVLFVGATWWAFHRRMAADEPFLDTDPSAPS